MSGKENYFSKHYDVSGVFDREDYGLDQREENGAIKSSYSKSTGYDYDGQIAYIRSSESIPSENKIVEELISYTNGTPTKKTVNTRYNYVVYETLTYMYENGSWVLENK